MMPGSDLLSLEQAVRQNISEETASLWNQTNVFRAINEEMVRLARHVLDLENGYLELVQTSAPSSGGVITLPIGCYVVRALDVSNGGAYVPLNWSSASKRFLYSTDAAYVVRFEGNTLVLDGGVGDVGSVRVHYGRIPPPLITGLTAAQTSSSITFATGTPQIDDLYNSMEGLTLSGTGAGQYFTISDYVGSTRVATVTPNWPVSIDVDTVYGTLLPNPIDRFPDVVAMGAALRLLYRRRDETLTNLIAQQYLSDRNDMLNSLRKRQTSVPNRVNHFPDMEELYGM